MRGRREEGGERKERGMREEGEERGERRERKERGEKYYHQNIVKVVIVQIGPFQNKSNQVLFIKHI